MAHLVRSVLEPETGIVPGWIENGGLFIANNKERLDEYKRLSTVRIAHKYFIICFVFVWVLFTICLLRTIRSLVQFVRIL